ncbi:MAG: ABC transporter ATP-binding protein [Bacillota bacterium]|jgi:ATP-binding cassette subfamily C protein|nr:ABC transporter ATP-binding protein [Bacillota bacterium]
MRRSGIKVMGELIGLVRPLAHIMVFAVVTGVLGYLTAIFITVFGGLAIAEILGFPGPLSLRTLLSAVIFLAVARGLLRYAEQLSNHYIAFKILALIRNKVFTALRRLAPAKLEGRDKGNLISIITSDIELLEVFYAHTISPIAIAFLTSLIMVAFIAGYSPLLAFLALAAYLTVGVLVPVGVSKLGSDVGLAYRNGFGDLNSFVLDSLRGLKEIIQYGMGQKRLLQLNARTDELSRKHRELKKYEGLAKAITDTVILFFSAAMLFTGLLLYTRGAVGFDGVLIPTIAMMSSFGPVVALSSLSNNLRHTLASGNRVLDLLEEEPVVEEVEDGKILDFGTVECSNIDFAYGAEPILEDYSLQIRENNIVGIHGRSGSGKSTLLKLLMRFWDVDNGRVAIAGEDIRNVNTSSLRNLQGYLTQETHLFNDTIAENIRIAKPDATLEEIIEAAKKAAVHDFIVSLPNGYETNVGELGESLSSGERQRIGLARVFLHDAPFVLLDEPTSNLDSLNEGMILKSLLEESENKTMVLVSHRKSTMNIADLVIEMESGRAS